MKKTVNHILAAGLLALLSLASCTDEFIEGNDLQGVDRDKRVEVRLPFGVGRGITTTITTRAAGGEIDYDSQLSGVMAFVYEAKSDNPEENELLAYHLFSNPSNKPLEGATGGWIADNDDPTCGEIKFYVPVGDVYIYLLGNVTGSWAMRKVRSLISFREYRVGMRWALRRSFLKKQPRSGTETYTA